MGRVVLSNATVFDGDGGRLEDATVVVDGDRIASVGTDSVEAAPDDRVIDLGGRSVMPGMVTSHFHATYHELGSVPSPFGLAEPPALQAVRAVTNLRLALEHGYTGAVSAGAPFAIDASMKIAIEQGAIPGPRLMAGSNDVSSTGHSNDLSSPWYWQLDITEGVRRCDGPDEFRKGVREEVKRGAEIIKMFLTSGHLVPGEGERIQVTFDEMSAAIEAAHQRGALVRGHLANAEAIDMAISAGIDVVDHGDGLNEALVERMAEAGTFLVPSVKFPYDVWQGLSALGIPADVQGDIEEMLAILPLANSAGVKILLGDDYGAMGFPHGRYGEELPFYVEHGGIPALDVIRWATKNGAELMGRGHELGTITNGKLADLLVVDGDVEADIALLADPSNLLAIVKGGEFFKDELASVHSAAPAAMATN